MPTEADKEHDATLRTPDALRQWRQNQGWTRNVLADELGVSHQAIKAWESGARPIPHMLPLALAELQRRHAAP